MPVKEREVLSFRSLPCLALYMALTLATIGFFAARSSENTERDMIPSASLPTAVMKSDSM